MKKNGRIVTILFIIAISGIIVFFLVKGKGNQTQNPTESSKNSTESVANTTQSTQNTNVQEGGNNRQPYTGKVSANAKIAEAFKSKKFIAENGIEEESIKNMKFVKLAKGASPVYIVVVKYGDSVENGKIFSVQYENGNVEFDVINEGKYLPDLFIDTGSKIMKTELTMRGGTRNVFYDASNDALVKKGTFMKPASDEYVGEVKYTYNEKEVTESEYNEKIKQYSKYNFKEFSEIAYDFTEENIDKYVR